jgi:hypothetical protein
MLLLLKIVLSLLVSCSLELFGAFPAVHGLQAISPIAQLVKSNGKGCVFRTVSSSRVRTDSSGRVRTDSNAAPLSLSNVVSFYSRVSIASLARSREIICLPAGPSPDNMPEPLEFIWVQMHNNDVPVGLPYRLDFMKQARRDIASVQLMVKERVGIMFGDGPYNVYSHDDKEYSALLGPEVLVTTEVHGGDSSKRPIAVNAALPNSFVQPKGTPTKCCKRMQYFLGIWLTCTIQCLLTMTL